MIKSSSFRTPQNLHFYWHGGSSVASRCLKNYHLSQIAQLLEFKSDTACKNAYFIQCPTQRTSLRTACCTPSAGCNRVCHRSTTLARVHPGRVWLHRRLAGPASGHRHLCCAALCRLPAVPASGQRQAGFGRPPAAQDWLCATAGRAPRNSGDQA